MAHDQQIISKIKDRTAVIGVIGLGYVGLPLMIRFGEEGFRTIGFDVDDSKVKRLNSGESYIKHIPSETIRQLRANDTFHATSNYAALGEVDGILICVPTPLTAGESRTSAISRLPPTT